MEKTKTGLETLNDLQLVNEYDRLISNRGMFYYYTLSSVLIILLFKYLRPAFWLLISFIIIALILEINFLDKKDRYKLEVERRGIKTKK